MWDVAIIGGGPAGVASALSVRQLASSAAITLLDDAHPGLRWKPGEVLSPAVTPLLESLDCNSILRELVAQRAALPCYGSHAAWGNSRLESNDFLSSLHGNGWRLDREQFDAALLHHAGNSGTVVRHNTSLIGSFEQADGSWLLQLQTLEGPPECLARFVIDAGGRSARFATQRGSRPGCGDKLGSVCMLFHTAEKRDEFISQEANKE